MITPVEPPGMPPAAQGRHTPGYLWWRAIQISLLAAFLYLYAAVLPPLVADWLDDPNYSHGFLVPGLSAYFVWDRRQTLTRLRPQPHWVGLIILLFGLGMLLLCLVCVVYLALGTKHHQLSDVSDAGKLILQAIQQRNYHGEE